MVNNLTSKLGSKFAIKQNGGAGEEVFSFPDPEVIASVNKKFLRDKIRAGYRSPYLLEFARRVESGNLNFETWKDKKLTTNKLFDRASEIK
jgi:N-glycosylase/DNA lyase